MSAVASVTYSEVSTVTVHVVWVPMTEVPVDADLRMRRSSAATPADPSTVSGVPGVSVAPW